MTKIEWTHRPGMKREKNPNWKGGKTVTEHGYVLVRVGTDHHLADVRGYAYEHRIVAEQKLGRRLRPGEIAHHVNGNRADNRPGNIEVLPSVGHHVQNHADNPETRRVSENNPIIRCACGCKAEFKRYDRWGRPRSFVSGHNLRPTLEGGMP